MERLLGMGNSLLNYVWMLGFYLMMFVLMRQGQRTVELSFRRSFTVLALIYGPAVFVANWLLYRAGWMSFLPWVNNAMHTCLWIGLGLMFLYAGSRRRPALEQFALFAIYSFLVKEAEHAILGTWERDGFFNFGGQFAYRVGWSLLDGLLPFLTAIGLPFVGRFVSGIER